MGTLACLKHHDSKCCFLYSVALSPSPRLGVGCKPLLAVTLCRGRYKGLSWLGMRTDTSYPLTGKKLARGLEGFQQWGSLLREGAATSHGLR